MRTYQYVNVHSAYAARACTSGSAAFQMDCTAMAMAAALCALIIVRIIMRF